MKAISFTSGGYRLAGNLFLPKQTQPKLAFLLIQGWTGHQNLQAAQALCDLGFAVMTYDMRGNGESEGDIAAFSRADFIADAETAYDELKNYTDKDAPLVVVGSSFGSYTAVLLSQERPVAALSLRVPASYPDEGFDKPQMAQIGTEDFRSWRVTPLVYNENKAFLALHDFKGPVQIIEAGSDELVPAQAVKNYVNAASHNAVLSYEIMPNALHRLANDVLQKQYEEILLSWVRRLNLR